MRFRCPNPDCRSTLKAKPEQIGKRFRCPKCEMLVTVPVVGELESGAGESRSLIDAESRAGESLLGVDSESDTGGSRSAVDTVAGDAGSTRDSAATSTDAEDAVAEVWKPGDVILELYEVKDVLGEGGFGTVFKVHHRGWNTDLAVKSPRAGLFQSKRQKKRFVDECQTWIDLGIHPNAVSCFYVRTLGGIPRVFAELVDGKDLKHWIAQKKIRNVKTVLDIAIQNRVSSVVFSPDGCCALSGSSDNTLRVWEVSTGRCLRTFEGHTDWVLSVVFSPDGRCALSASGDKTVRLWELSTGRCLRTFEGHTGKISSVAVSPDSRRALSASGDKTVRLWELSTGRCLKTFKRSDFEVHSVAFSADGRCALLGSYKTLSLRDLSTGRCLRTFKGHVRDVILVVISPDGRWALSGSDDKTLRLWELATGRCLRTFEGHTTSVNSVAFSPDGQCALSGSGATVNSDDNTLRLWELLKAPPRGSCAIAVPQDAAELGKKAQEADKAIEKGRAHIAEGRYRAAIAVISEARRIRGYERRRELLQLHHQLSIACVRRSLQAGWCTQTCEVGWNSARSVAFIPDGRRALLASYETLHLFELSTGRCLRTFKGHEKPVNSVALSSDGCWALTGSEDKTLCLWELSAGRCLRTFKGHTERVYSVALGSDGRWAVSGGGDSTLRLWELDWEYGFPGHANWDEGARPWLQDFLTFRSSRRRLLRRWTRPKWTEEGFAQLLSTLQNAGFGWLRPEGVRRELEKMTAKWQGPPPLAADSSVTNVPDIVATQKPLKSRRSGGVGSPGYVPLGSALSWFGALIVHIVIPLMYWGVSRMTESVFLACILTFGMFVVSLIMCIVYLILRALYLRRQSVDSHAKSAKLSLAWSDCVSLLAVFTPLGWTWLLLMVGQVGREIPLTLTAIFGVMFVLFMFAASRGSRKLR